MTDGIGCKLLSLEDLANMFVGGYFVILLVLMEG
jgi:hypothetical protein